MAFKDFLRALTLRTAFLITTNIAFNCIYPFFSIYLQWLGLNILQMSIIRAVQTWTSTLMIPVGKLLMKKLWRTQCKKCLIQFSILLAVVCYLCMIVLSQHSSVSEEYNEELERLNFKETKGFLLPNVKVTSKIENSVRSKSASSTTTSLPVTTTTLSIIRTKPDLNVNSNYLTKPPYYDKYDDWQSERKGNILNGNKNLELKKLPKINISEIFSDKFNNHEVSDNKHSNQSASPENLVTQYIEIIKNQIRNEDKPSPRFEEVTLKPDSFNSGDIKTINILGQLKPLQNTYEFKKVTYEDSENGNKDTNMDAYIEEDYGGDETNEEYKLFKDNSGKQSVPSTASEFDNYDSIISSAPTRIMDKNYPYHHSQNKNFLQNLDLPEVYPLHNAEETDKETDKVKYVINVTPNTFVNELPNSKFEIANNQRETEITDMDSKINNDDSETDLESKNMESYFKYMQMLPKIKNNKKQHQVSEDKMISSVNRVINEEKKADEDKYIKKVGKYDSHKNVNKMIFPDNHASNKVQSFKRKNKYFVGNLNEKSNFLKNNNLNKDMWHHEKVNEFSNNDEKYHEYFHDIHRRRLLAIFKEKDFDVSDIFKLPVLSLNHENAAYISKLFLVFVLGVLSETVMTLLIPCVTSLWHASHADKDLYHIKLWKVISWGIITCPVLAGVTITTYKLPELLPHLWLTIICLMVAALLVFCIPAPKYRSKYENLDIPFQTDVSITTYATRNQSRYAVPVLGLIAGALTACNSEFMFWHMLSRSKNLISFEIASYLYIIITALVKAPIYWCLRYRGMLKQSNSDISLDNEYGNHDELYRMAILFPLGHFFLGLQLVIMCFTSSNFTVIYLAILCGASGVMLKCVKCKSWYSWGYGIGCLGGGIVAWLKDIPYLFFISGFGSLVWSVILFLFVCIASYKSASEVVSVTPRKSKFSIFGILKKPTETLNTETILRKFNTAQEIRLVVLGKKL